MSKKAQTLTQYTEQRRGFARRDEAAVFGHRKIFLIFLL